MVFYLLFLCHAMAEIEKVSEPKLENIVSRFIHISNSIKESAKKISEKLSFEIIFPFDLPNNTNQTMPSVSSINENISETKINNDDNQMENMEEQNQNDTNIDEINKPGIVIISSFYEQEKQINADNNQISNEKETNQAKIQEIKNAAIENIQNESLIANMSEEIINENPNETMEMNYTHLENELVNQTMISEPNESENITFNVKEENNYTILVEETIDNSINETEENNNTLLNEIIEEENNTLSIEEENNYTILVEETIDNPIDETEENNNTLLTEEIEEENNTLSIEEDNNHTLLEETNNTLMTNETEENNNTFLTEEIEEENNTLSIEEDNNHTLLEETNNTLMTNETEENNNTFLTEEIEEENNTLSKQEDNCALLIEETENETLSIEEESNHTLIVETNNTLMTNETEENNFTPLVEINKTLLIEKESNNTLSTTEEESNFTPLVEETENAPETNKTLTTEESNTTLFITGNNTLSSKTETNYTLTTEERNKTLFIDENDTVSTDKFEETNDTLLIDEENDNKNTLLMEETSNTLLNDENNSTLSVDENNTVSTNRTEEDNNTLSIEEGNDNYIVPIDENTLLVEEHNCTLFVDENDTHSDKFAETKNNFLIEEANNETVSTKENETLIESKTEEHNNILLTDKFEGNDSTLIEEENNKIILNQENNDTLLIEETKEENNTLSAYIKNTLSKDETEENKMHLMYSNETLSINKTEEDDSAILIEQDDAHLCDTINNSLSIEENDITLTEENKYSLLVEDNKTLLTDKTEENDIHLIENENNSLSTEETEENDSYLIKDENNTLSIKENDITLTEENNYSLLVEDNKSLLTDKTEENNYSLLTDKTNENDNVYIIEENNHSILPEDEQILSKDNTEEVDLNNTNKEITEEQTVNNETMAQTYENVQLILNKEAEELETCNEITEEIKETQTDANEEIQIENSFEAQTNEELETKRNEEKQTDENEEIKADINEEVQTNAFEKTKTDQIEETQTDISKEVQADANGDLQAEITLEETQEDNKAEEADEINQSQAEISQEEISTDAKADTEETDEINQSQTQFQIDTNEAPAESSSTEESEAISVYRFPETLSFQVASHPHLIDAAHFRSVSATDQIRLLKDILHSEISIFENMQKMFNITNYQYELPLILKTIRTKASRRRIHRSIKTMPKFFPQFKDSPIPKDFNNLWYLDNIKGRLRFNNGNNFYNVSKIVFQKTVIQSCLLKKFSVSAKLENDVTKTIAEFSMGDDQYEFNLPDVVRLRTIYINILDNFGNETGSCVPDVVFYENKTLHLSAILKVWVEGGSYTYNGENFDFESLGMNFETKEEIISVTPISSSDFELMSLESIINYDIIVIGFMDMNGGPYCQSYSETVQRVWQYIDLNYSVLFGHDVVGYFYGNSFGYGQIADKFGIKLGSATCNVSGYCSTGTISTNWNHFSKEIKVTNRGLVTNYPYYIPSDVSLPINLTHTSSNAAFGDVWVELGEFENPNFGNFTEIENYEWTLDGYSGTRYGNPHYYLTTYKNTAMIQTGHLLGSATLYERQLLVNTIYYLYQRTSLQYGYDNSVETPKLNPPNITRIEGERSIEINTSNNYETATIYYKVVAYTTNEIKYESSPTQFNLTTFVKKYYYIIDENENTNITKENLNEDQITNGTITNIKDGDLHVHVASIDNYGILSGTSHIFITKELSTLTFTKSNTYSQTNTITKSNTPTESNINKESYTYSKTFSGSNIISSTYTSTFPIDASVSHSFILLQQKTYTKSITIKTMYYSYSYTKSLTNSYSHIFIYTEFIYYEYDYVIYSYLRTYYSDFFTLVYYEFNQANDTISTNVLIGIVCCSFAIVLIIIGIIIYLYKKNKNKQNTKSSSNFGNNIAADKKFDEQMQDLENDEKGLSESIAKFFGEGDKWI
ncbi:Ig domain-containing protein [Histomonas meleagridis]|uniref:Ig domain-containing protein n=1 Tax=Histomonas meleagridis TaxID=135588 RepID=UPI00355A45F3|nr:Ig domain-containing protein [Histomonas meleagridis]KAH0799826.1 Ig domain-containing protein [Histomonas meleagridis]